MPRPISLHTLAGGVSADMIPMPDEPFYFRGPRGGRYRGYGPWKRRIGMVPGDFIRDQLTVMDKGTSGRRLRPGSLEWKLA